MRSRGKEEKEKKREPDDSFVRRGEEGMEHPMVGCCFLVERQGIGAGGGGHAPKTDGSGSEGGVDILAYFGCWGVKYFR